MTLQFDFGAHQSRCITCTRSSAIHGHFPLLLRLLRVCRQTREVLEAMEKDAGIKVLCPQACSL